jgi:trans-aconitate methyltransferase
MSEQKSSHVWDAKLYDDRHAFVNQLAKGVVELLAPRKGERILDLGCGTGPLTQQIADAGAEVTGIDASPAMIAQARQTYPGLQFEVADALTMNLSEQFDAIFSNAVLHWVKPPEIAAQRMYAALKPGGRLVLEMGGKGCVGTILREAINAGQAIGIDLKSVVDINYFPGIAQYASVLEQAGFKVTFATLFDRPTLLSDGDAGLANWIRMFRPGVEKAISPEKQTAFFAELGNRCRDKLYSADAWHADYVRLRVMAVKL